MTASQQADENREPSSDDIQPESIVPHPEKQISDLLFRESVYPDPTGLFAFESRPIEEVIYECIIVLDTNQLLLPYTVSKNTIDEIGRLYEDLDGQGRLIVPAQAAREFVDNRFTKIGDALHALHEYRSRINNFVKHQDPKLDYPFLKALDEYKPLNAALNHAQRKANECRGAYREVTRQINLMIDTIRDKFLSDPVSLLYRKIFKEHIVCSIPFDHDSVLSEFHYRKANRIPPGFNDQRIGDLLIWKVILHV